MDKLTSMRAFTRVVHHGAYSAAAREMGLSRAAVSKYVSELEEELGVQLLHRTTRKVTPTQDGLAYYGRCLAILADIEDADLAVSRFQAEPRGVLRINAPMSFGTLHLGPAIADSCWSAVTCVYSSFWMTASSTRQSFSPATRAIRIFRYDGCVRLRTYSNASARG